MPRTKSIELDDKKYKFVMYSYGKSVEWELKYHTKEKWTQILFIEKRLKEDTTIKDGERKDLESKLKELTDYLNSINDAFLLDKLSALVRVNDEPLTSEYLNSLDEDIAHQLISKAIDFETELTRVDVDKNLFSRLYDGFKVMDKDTLLKVSDIIQMLDNLTEEHSKKK